MCGVVSPNPMVRMTVAVETAADSLVPDAIPPDRGGRDSLP